MREYRGKRKDTEEWIYGSLVIDDDKYYICLGISEHIKRDDYEVYMIEVDLETVGQYIGKLDSKANKIFEKDIVKGIRRTNQYEEYEYFEVKFHNGCFMAGNFNMHEFFDKFSHKEAIGNVIDNPELLENNE